MNLIARVFILLFGICICEAGYGIGETQSDVQAPGYIPPYARNQIYSRGYGGGYSGRKTSYSGTKTGYAGTKTGYTGTQTGYTGTKTGYAGTKTGYSGTKTGYTGYGPPGPPGPVYNHESSYRQFFNNANAAYTAKCEIECMNNGICVDTNTCQCPPNFNGKYCEFEKKPCLFYPPLPANSDRRCSPDYCTITCMEGHKFIDGTTVADMRCVNGQWQPTRADLTSIPDCKPECDPPCLNGGACLSVNMCQCPADYRGPQCQYSASVCDFRNLGFNGGYRCFGDSEKFSCVLNCPSGAWFSTPPADTYVCEYATGVFLPQPIPQCVYEQVIVVTPVNTHNNPYALRTPNATDINHYEHTTQGSGKYGSGNVKKPIIVVQDLTPKGGSCLTWSGLHYKTFDGKIYSFQTSCNQILVRDASEHKYTVAVKQTQCERQGYCPYEITVYLDEKMYSLSTSFDGSLVFRNSKRRIPIPATLPGIRVSMPSDHVLVDLDAGITLKWDTNDVLLVEGSVLVWNKTEGLCGTLDGNPEDDMITKEGIVAKTKSVLFDSWKLHDFEDMCGSNTTETSACNSKSDEDMKKAAQFCTNIFTKEKFRKCAKVMDVSQLLEACQWDYCACTTSLSPEECACRTVSVYAKECLRHGIEEMKSWRDPETCPLKCPEGKIYKSCGPDTQPSCASPELSATSNSSCVEGCYCPEGLLLETGRCVPKSECLCRVRNRTYPPGTVIPKSCNTCKCEMGEWVCTQVPCGARCGAVGDPHYTTFDGLRYNFMGHCTYTLLKTENITIDAENVACSGAITEAMNLSPYHGEGKPSCTKAVYIQHFGANINLKQGGFILVNGKEVTALPAKVGDIKIRAASSLFIMIQMPGKVSLWWDGNTRVFVDVPPAYHDKTQGLCGTFNLNQKDDFLTPEGDVEQSVLAFANKWKTREFCDDVSTTEQEHPCKANVENKDNAEKYCSQLKSTLFESCHWYVDVQQYYEDCLYDMCACTGDDMSRCLCPILADYADACARAGVMIQWRYNVKECEIQCTGGQEYTVCADSCLRTCTDVGLPIDDCKPSCVEGCACPVGQVLDNDNVCVPVSLCPCYHKGMEFKHGYKEVRAGKRERELCTCMGARWECQPASQDQIQNYPPAEDVRSNCSAAHNMEFTTCAIAEPLTCKNMHLQSKVNTQECRPGCQCKKGYVMDVSSKKCIEPTSCPCHHGGQSFPDGHTMKEGCNTCRCKGGKWRCSGQVCAGVCSVWGDSHVTTFDGQTYDFEGVCSYLLVKGIKEGTDGFSVEIQNEPCGTTGATCSKSVTLRVSSAGTEETVSLTKSAPLPDTSKLKNIMIRQAGAYVFLDVLSRGMSVQWDRGLRVYVRVNAMWQDRVKGLCGNFNSDKRDDFQTPSGGDMSETSALIFADSWKLKSTCPKPLEVTDHCIERPHRKEWASSTCGVMKRHPFSLCHAEVPPSDFVSRCEADACACDSGADCDCACAAIAAYAHACVERGVTFKWRTQELCPMQCDEECSNYHECISPCPPETCENRLDYKQITAACEKETCVEGCKSNKTKTCPYGTLYYNSSLTECVPRAKCIPPCMILEDGREIQEGEIIEEDPCHNCRCSQGHKTCIGQPCITDWETTTHKKPKETTPHDRPMSCAAGWTEWINRGDSFIDSSGASVDLEPLPEFYELTIGSPMCEKGNMTGIECRTATDHKSPKETGFNVECSLEKGLVCSETEKTCPDFEIRVLCQCEIVTTPGLMTTTPTTAEPFQCLDSTHPNYQHPTNCGQFYECTPDLLNPGKIHTVLKNCSDGLMYNPTAMVCDWPASVVAIRPECGDVTSSTSTTAKPTEMPVPVAPSEERAPGTTSTTTVGTTSACPPGQVFKSCAFKCDKLCDHFKQSLRNDSKCLPGQECVDGCVDESVANVKCEFGSMWRDHKTCVPIKDCTCDDSGKIVKPGGVVIYDCKICQCLDNALHCDTSACVSTIKPITGSPISQIKITETTHLPTIVETVATTYIPALNATPPVTSTTHFTTIAPFITTTPLSTERVTTPTTPTIPTTPSTHVPVIRSETETTVIIISTTESPPPECNPSMYKNLLWEGKRLPKESFTASSYINPMFEPQYAILNGHASDNAGAWNPEENDKNPYIQVQLPRREPIYGVQLQGSPLFDEYVESYEMMYGDDGNVFSTVNSPDGHPKIFRGPVDSKQAMKQMIEPPIEAKFVRIKPLTWHNAISVRFELIGCDEVSTTAAETTTASTTEAFTTPERIQCTELLGFGGGLPIEMIEVSSNFDARPYLKLDSERGWRPLYSTPGEWIMFNFTSPRNLTGIKTKGGEKGHVTAYNVMYTSDLKTFNPVLDSSGKPILFPANFDKDSVVLNEFRPPIHAQYLKILPVKWEKNIEISVEPIGCFEPYPTSAPPPVTPSFPCQMCPGVQEAICTCAGDRYFDGEDCVPRDQCPCLVGFIPYPVGATYRGEKCDECFCKVGGVTDCKPAKQCECEPDFVPSLTPSCDCLCEPCKNGTKICPTSKLCLKLEKWCDGLQDCPDDEKDCTTLAPVTETVVTTVIPTVAATKPTSTTPAPTTETPTTTTTEKPLECPKVECPPGYFVRTTTGHGGYSKPGTSDLPPPRSRNAYQRFYKGGFSKGGRGGFAKGGRGGFSKTSYSKGGIYGPPSRPLQNDAFQLDRPTLNRTTADTKKVCPVFKCIPKLPPIPPKGSTPAPQVCSTPTCPPQYTLKLESVPDSLNLCPQYVCVPPPERFDYCNVTGRTFSTFDGTEYKYDICYHTLARDKRSNAWIIVARKKCLKDTCLNELLVLQDDQLILVKPNLMIDYNGYEYTIEQTSKICFQKNSFDVNRLGNGVFVKSRKYNFTVFYNPDGDVKVGVSKKYMGYVDGLCGAYDGQSYNDRSTPNGRLVNSIEQFGNSWAKPGLARDACEIKVIPPAKQNRCLEVCKAITEEPIAQCARVLNLDKWRSICLENVCKCAETVVNGTKKTEEECRCLLLEKLVAECLAADKDLDIASWRIQMNCPAECPPPLVHYDCYRKPCEPTCAAINSGVSTCAAEDGQCFPGCYCPEGTLRKGDQCVAPSDCLDCTCTGVGTPAKYVTFEGDDLPFLGNCTYLASRDTNDTGYHKYQVYSTNGPCADSPSMVCTKALHLIQEKNFINITKDANTKKLITIVNGMPVYKYPFTKDWVTVSLLNGQDVNINLPELHVEVTVLQAKMEFTVQVPSQLYANRTQGLCGVCAGYQQQLITSNGTVAENFDEYGKSWQATPEILNTLKVPLQEQCDEAPPRPECVLPPIESNPCYNINNVAKFGACHALVEPEPYISLCEDELCESNSTNACPILERYAADCRKQGVCLDWRSDLCPYPCDEPLVYRPCVDCERTCDNHDDLEANPKKCDQQPIEGCFCPQGKVRVNNTCIEPNKCFPCDAKKEHYAGDEWQEDACTKCSCSKLPDENAAHVTCATQTCTVPVCSDLENRFTVPGDPSACCPEYMCVLKPLDERCEEPKKLECGFGQVLKTKTRADGCKEFACECKPEEECDPIPEESEVEMIKHGVKRVVDRSGCCPKVELICVACPKPPACPKFQTLKTTNISGECCPEHKCELPKDKCVVNLEWQAASKGGEERRPEPEVMLKDMDAAWLDGPCRSCRCVASLGGAAAQCAVAECPAVLSTEQFVLEPRAVPFACCPAAAHVACRDGDYIYKVGENWTSPYDVCESYKCSEMEDGKLEKVTTVQNCDTDCQPGWEYFPASPDSKQCCGKCKPVACVVDGVTRQVGQSWTSPDFCTNYTCKDLNGTLQVQSVNESCPEITEALKKQFVLSKDKIPGKCCLKEEPIACRVENKIYQEGQSWTTSNPCKNYTCARDVTGRLSHETSVENCVKECNKDQKYVEPGVGVCCGHCVQDKCIVGDELKQLGESWKSPDNCTTYSCDGTVGQVSLTSSPELCPDVSDCAPENLVNQTCCQVCKLKPSDQSKCVPTPIPQNDTLGLIRIPMSFKGLCVNKHEIPGFQECRGSCDSSTIYSKEAGRHESLCECCQATHYRGITLTLDCDDGTRVPHRVASPVTCGCRGCGAAERPWQPAPQEGSGTNY
ncbi:hemocytin isoform X2 [Pararge aegeria]|uniref:hemocytin isoform X2 n=1 Tax=Pararge aegeria TaxID=116150 RepID=UPI0019D2775E|nr:hemocytin isoform X2 [Pararge aegeria]